MDKSGANVFSKYRYLNIKNYSVHQYRNEHSESEKKTGKKDYRFDEKPTGRNLSFE
ncbi:hypothetical protein [Aestuariibacter sp. A3R04]|uniref:hypothetical protein n=1 Tax=Aestuariibacter sp. A3R04 TaxID=2841571 RepID=UPI001C0A6220|nr:hypothetical protein [Aestuariibacter sp. A3R04]MBU3022926.1 hypothetical protein [Aestuariibacter sp. A3R04]